MPNALKITLTTLLLGLLPGLVAYAQDEDVLRPEDAYRYAIADTGDAIEIDWAVEDGYYLYRNKMSYASGSDAIVLGDVEMPEGEHHEDEFFGVQQVYRDRFFVRIPYTVVGDIPSSADIIIKSQGCADIGLCYPPQTWQESVRLIARNDDGGKIDLDKTFGTFGGANADFLPVDEVFEPILMALDGNTVEVAIRVLDGYYLYKDKISATIDSDVAQAGKLELPQGELKTDQYFGEMEVYHGDVFGKLPIARGTPEAMTLDFEVKYQGCADGGICYPPVTRIMSVDLPQATMVSALSAAVPAGASGAPVSEQARLAQLITGSSMLLVVATFFGAGLLLAFTPCVLPMVPILSGIIAGEGDDVSATRGFSLAFTYVMGMAVVYTLAGIAAAAVGVQLQAIFNAPWVLAVFSGLFVILALSMFGMFELQMPSAVQSKLSVISGKQKSGTFVGAFIMGALSSLIVTACVAPPLVATLTVIGQTGDMLRGGTALFALSMGMGTPLLLVGASAGKLIPQAGAWMDAVKNAFGFMMLGLAIWMMSRVLPGELTLALWGVLIFMAGVYLGGLTQLTADSLGMQKLGKGFGLLAIIYGAVLLVGSLAGSNSMLKPLAALNTGSANGAAVAEEQGLEFQRIKTTDDLDAALAAAASQGKSAMLDFYADWCVSCIEMEHYTFTDGGVRNALANSVLLQADVTANDAEDQALLKRFGVFGPPTIIFFGADGLQRHGYEVVGYMKAKEFADHVRMATGNNTTISASN
ncbi:MAG: thiol:disulfide interchange protein DsbD [Woeseiaceae bacterium]|jgi:thiol:disulfide interchange protein DsbD